MADVAPSEHKRAARRLAFTPKLVTALKQGYRLADLRADSIAGLTVAVVALPLSMAIAISSGVQPAAGLFTAIVAGALISALGGSMHQIGGPTAAFIVIVAGVVAREGYDGLVLATLIAGFVLILLGALKLGSFVKYVPYPVVTGFTAGIAVSIFASQWRDLLGLKTALPSDFIPKVATALAHLAETNAQAVGVTILTLGLIVAIRKWRPRWPVFLIAVGAVTIISCLFHLDVETIGTRFGGVPRTLPAPYLPDFDFATLRKVLPDALTIALLAGIESLLSAVVADGMTGRRHRSNIELIAQGVANIGSVLFGGISATGAIARTATNIRSGGRTPLAGILHAVFVALFMAVFAPLLSYIPLAALSSVLVIVAISISEIHHIERILTKGDNADRIILILTFGLTVLTDLTIGISVGLVGSAFIFMHRMAEAVEVEARGHGLAGEDDDEAPFASRIPPVPKDVVVVQINGPFFFGASQRVSTIMERIGPNPRAYIVDVTGVPFIDSTALASLTNFVGRAAAQKARLIFAGARGQVLADLDKLPQRRDHVESVPTLQAAVELLSS